MRPRAARGKTVLARYFNVYRLAAYALVLYTLGHTLGAVVPTPAFGPESDAVVSMMKSVHVDAQGADCTWYGFYRGFGAFVSLFLAYSAFMAWYLGGKTVTERRAHAPLSWGLFLAFGASIVITAVWFFPAPQVFSTVVTLLLGIGCLRDWIAVRDPRSG